MIGSLSGVLRSKQAPWLVVDVGGVGYEVEVPMSTYFALPVVGDPLTLITHLVVREDAQLLYGFATEDERRLFRRLIKVSGVGARVALAILSGISVEGFARCVQFEDAASLIKVPGIGKKTADRLIVEMRDGIELITSTSRSHASSAAGRIPASAEQEASSALIALGYKAPEVGRLLRALDTESLSPEEIIRQALRQAAGTAS